MKKTVFVFIFAIIVSVSLVWAGSQQTSSTLASTIVTKARYHLNDADINNNYLWSDEELLTYINDGILDIQSRSHALETTKVITLTPDTIAYAISAVNYISIIAAIYDNGTSPEQALLRGNLQSIGWVEELGEPAYWIDWGGSVLLYPRANTEASGDQVTLYLLTRPSAITLNDNIPIPAHYDHILPLYVAARAYFRDGQTGKASRLMAEYEVAIDRWRADFNERPKEPREIRE
jgi:hypothetical protein